MRHDILAEVNFYCDLSREVLGAKSDIQGWRKKFQKIVQIPCQTFLVYAKARPNLVNQLRSCLKTLRNRLDPEGRRSSALTSTLPTQHPTSSFLATKSRVGIPHSAYMRLTSDDSCLSFQLIELPFYSVPLAYKRFETLFRTWFSYDPQESDGKWHPEATMGLCAVVTLALQTNSYDLHLMSTAFPPGQAVSAVSTQRKSFGF